MFSNTPKNKFMNEKLHLISYGDEKYMNAKKRIYNEALNTNWFYSIKCSGKEDLSIGLETHSKSYYRLEEAVDIGFGNLISFSVNYMKLMMVSF